MASFGPKIIVLSCGCYWETERLIDLGQMYSCASEGHGDRPVMQMSDRDWFWRYVNDGS